MFVLTWLRLVRVFNVPIPLAAMLVGTLSATPSVPTDVAVFVTIAALLGTAGVQSYNDYEDRNEDSVNAAFRPIPAGELSAAFVLWNGHVCFAAWLLLSLLFNVYAAAMVVVIFLLVRWYSRLKKFSLVHHVLLPAALGMMPPYGAMMALGTRGTPRDIPAVSWLAGASIVLIDINMNIVGAFKDLFDGAAEGTSCRSCLGGG
jgi:4-hydroxybenzoate polyprenyltransferase